MKKLLARITGRGDDAPQGLFAETVRTVVVLVGATVLFVGALSTAAVLVTSKAVGASPASASDSHESSSSSTASAPKKPLSI